MSDTVIRFENVSKMYQLGEVGTGSLVHDLNRWWHTVRGKEDPYSLVAESNDRTARGASDHVWALKDIDFEVKRGDVLGLIGRNGAGKSTLLKILSRVTAPTRGEVKVRGRIASLLEVGTGFHPDLTGRDNVYLNGSILGMRKAEIDSKFDEIVDFSGCERYIDTPVKRYSSGMQVRLGFAVAAHLDPDILVVDEVLAVGDAEFQKRCLGKMDDISKTGRTILFVSHNLAAVRTLCNRGVIFANGQLAFDGSTDDAANRYINGAGGAESVQIWDDPTDAPGDDVFRLRRVAAKSASGDRDFCSIDEDVTIEIDFEVLKFQGRVSVSLHFLTQGACAFVGGTPSEPAAPGSYRVGCRVPRNLLNNVTYSLTVFLITDVMNFRVIERDVISFDVEEIGPRGEYLGEVIGSVRPQLGWSRQPLSEPSEVPV